MIDKNQVEDSNLEIHGEKKISRRKLLASLGLAGAAVAAGGIFNSGVLSNKAHGQSVTNSVYKNSTQSTISSSNGIFNVKDFGAIGNGEKNDTEAIKLAIEACSQSGGILSIGHLFNIGYTTVPKRTTFRCSFRFRCTLC